MPARTFVPSPSRGLQQVASVLALACLASCAGRSSSPPSDPSPTLDVASRGVRPDIQARPPNAGASDSAVASQEERAAEASPRQRPGLGTEYGEQRHSPVVETAFTRRSSSPDVVLSMRYDDADGITRLARSRGHQGWRRARAEASGLVLSITDENFRPLDSIDIDGQHHVVGRHGDRYMLGVENHTSERWEVVASVDGLDVIDGSPADFDERGYVLDPRTSMMIEGWRTSSSEVAAFRFGSVSSSYAERRGMGRNIGVIGAAFFREEGSSRWQRPIEVEDPWSEMDRRRRAEPFPGRFAPPPP